MGICIVVFILKIMIFRNIFLAGGVSLLPGLAERLEVEVASLVAPIIHTQVLFAMCYAGHI